MLGKQHAYVLIWHKESDEFFFCLEWKSVIQQCWTVVIFNVNQIKESLIPFCRVLRGLKTNLKTCLSSKIKSKNCNNLEAYEMWSKISIILKCRAFGLDVLFLTFLKSAITQLNLCSAHSILVKRHSQHLIWISFNFATNLNQFKISFVSEPQWRHSCLKILYSGPKRKTCWDKLN